MTYVLNSDLSHAVASQLTASSAVAAPTRPSSRVVQPGYVERYDLDIWSDGTVSQTCASTSASSPHSGGYTPTTWAQRPTSSVSFHEEYAPHMHSAPTTPPVGAARSAPPGTIRGPLPPVPNSLSQIRWAGSEQQIMQDVYGGRFGGHD